VSDQCPEDGLAGLPIDGPQALRLGQRQAQSRHFGVLGSNSAREFVFRIGARADLEKSARHHSPERQEGHQRCRPVADGNELGINRLRFVAGCRPSSEDFNLKPTS
jgi:hypothetical protein